MFGRNIRFRSKNLRAIRSFLDSEKYGQLDKNNCPYFSSVLLENMRWHPVAESLPHQATENLTIGGYEIKKGTTVVGLK